MGENGDFVPEGAETFSMVHKKPPVEALEQPQVPTLPKTADIFSDPVAKLLIHKEALRAVRGGKRRGGAHK